jgi:arylsulfatase A-like enzyme
VITRRRIAIALGLLVLGAAGWLAFDAWKLYLPGLIAGLVDPIGPPQPIVWSRGPDTAPPRRPPNVVVILADDLGWNDLTFAGGGVAGGAVPTPAIDSLAREGVQFRAGYAGNATCAPSRAAILTGRYPTRFGFEFTPAPKAFMRLVAGFDTDGVRRPVYYAEREKDVPPVSAQGLPAREITLAELLHGAGYHTVGLGKWHLGESPEMRPEAQGFDEYLGFLPGASLYLPVDHPDVVNSKQEFDPIDIFLWANLPFAVRWNGGPRFAPERYLTDYLADEAVKAIEANRKRPFFLYFAPNAPHTPLQALRSDYEALAGIEDHRLRVYGAMIRALDRAVGRVLGALEANGLAEDTLVFFTTDNGGANYVGLPELNRPYRGWKMTFFEGGVHAPFFAKWPRRIQAGTSFAEPVAHLDVFATAAAAAGVALPADRAMDGVNLLPFLRGEADGRPHEALFWRSGHYRTVRAGDWKLQLSERPARAWLFDLAADPTEQVDLALRRPEKLAELRALLARFEAEMVQPAWPSLIEGPIAIDHAAHVPDRPEEEHVYWAN